MSQTSLTNELTGKTGIQTDHGSLEFGDLIVIMLDLVLLIYTGWRSYDFLTNTVPDGFQMLAIIGLWGLDIGAIGWSMVWMFGSTAKYQDWTAMSFFVIDLLGVILTSVTDALMYGTPEGTLTKTLTSVAVVVVPLVVVGNVVAGFIYHMTSPRTKAMRVARKAQAEHKEKMEEIAGMERELIYAEQYLLAKQDQVEKSVLLADMKKDQDAIEMATLARLRDRVGAHTASKNVAAGPNGNLTQMQSRLSEMANQLRSLGQSDKPGTQTPASSIQENDSQIIKQPYLLDGQNHDQQVEQLIGTLPHPTTDPVSLIPSPLLIAKPELAYHPVQLTPIKFNSKIDCDLNGETIKIGDALIAIKNQNKQYKIYKPEASAPFCLVIEDDFRILQNGEPLKDPAQLADPIVVGGNGHKAALSPL